MKKSNIFYGWYIVVFCLLLMAVCYAPRVSGASLFIKPITDEMGFARSAYTLTSTVATLLGVFLAPFVGKLMARKNMTIILAICIIGVSLGYASYSTANSLIGFYLRAIIVGIFGTGASTISVSILITSWFKAKRGFAMSLALAGSGIGGAILSPLIGNWITIYGWRKTYIILGIIMFVVLVPLCLLIVKQKPSDKGLEAYGSSDKTEKNNTYIVEWEPTLKEIRKMPLFWSFILGVAIISLTGGIVSHIPSAIMDAGYSTQTAASIASLYLLIAVPGKILLGYIFDKYGARVGILFGNGIFTLSVVSLLFIDKEIILYIMAVLFGIGTCIGTVTTPVLTSRLFGTKHYPEIYGFVTMFINGGFAIGVPFIASIYDITGSYNLAWTIIIILSIIMTISLLFSVKKCKNHKSNNL